jgi:DNA repair exonuclease SbcCD nuclease subunit
MRLAIMSDLHLEFREKQKHSDQSLDNMNRKRFYGNFSLPKEIDADIIVFAGDIHPNIIDRARFYSDIMSYYNKIAVFTNGNHDYYGSAFPYMQPVIREKYHGKRFVSGTGWTDLSHTHSEINYPINDIPHIKNWNFKQWTETHRLHFDEFLSDKYDIVVSHHCPSKMSCHLKYENDILNPFFYTNYTAIIEKMSKTKLWIHGHTHIEFDYMCGNVRVVCHPLGYPKENYEEDFLYEPKIVEI